MQVLTLRVAPDCWANEHPMQIAAHIAFLECQRGETCAERLQVAVASCQAIGSQARLSANRRKNSAVGSVMPVTSSVSIGYGRLIKQP